MGFDDYLVPLDWKRIDEELAFAASNNSVVLLHAHEPGATVSIETVERLFKAAAKYDLRFVTFSELSPNTPRAGMAVAFDDHTVASWHARRDLFARYNARLTFFITLLAEMTPAELVMLGELAADGHAIEAHSVMHLSAPEYVAERGVDAYVNDEALPSIGGLRSLGYRPTSYAYPYGAGVEPATTRLLDTVDRVRVGLGSCPH